MEETFFHKSNFWPQFIEFLPLLSIPLISGFIGWLTNKVAIQMTFYPLEYKGIWPLGWQGIIPAKSRKIAEKSVDLLTIKLIRMEEHFALLELSEVESHLRWELRKLSRKMADAVFQKQAPQFWENTPSRLQNAVAGLIEEELPHALRGVFSDIQKEINQILDLKKLTIEALIADKSILNEIFWRCGYREFRFIELSGLYMGAFFGLLQMVVFYFFSPWWLLPLFGIITGFITNWLALKLVFRPLKPIKLGNYEVQGLFLKRQKEVAAAYSALVTENILTTRAIFDYLFYGPGLSKIHSLARRHTDAITKRFLGTAGYVYQLLNGKASLAVTQDQIFGTFAAQLPALMEEIVRYADGRLEIRERLESKMGQLPYHEFEGFLRPAFQEDESTLILVGSLLGGVAGILQFALLFG